MTHDPTRLAAAALAALAWLLLCAAIAWRQARRRRLGDAGAPHATLVAFASQTGFAEELAHATAEALAANGAAVEVAEIGALTAEAMRRWPRILFVVATTGEGAAPDPAARFVRTVMSERPNLAGVEVGVLALGDRSYAAFCAFGRRLESWLADCGARPLFSHVEVDAGDPAALEVWRGHVEALQPGAAMTELHAAPTDPWRLTARSWLNPQGRGDPAFLIGLEPPAGSQPVWSAGDVIEIEQAFDGVPHRREYSIASARQDGRIELIVRRRRGDDGRLGVMSGWLTGDLLVGETVQLRLRVNRSFHAPEGDPPMVLIGAGTGLAGLRAHLKARAAAGSDDAWLIFGERTRRGDFLLGDEIEGWRDAGVLSRLDLAFSRDAGGPRYVQEVLKAKAGELRERLARGAVIYVCGSHANMGASVHAALGELLGEAALQALIEDGRYRRDTY